MVISTSLPNGNHHLSQSIFGTILLAFHAENTLRPVLTLTGIIGYINIHGTYAFTLAAGNAFLLIAFYPEQRKVTHRLQEHRDGTDILTECPVILECKRQYDTGRIVQNVPYNE